jgi:hypothetical protein
MEDEGGFEKTDSMKSADPIQEVVESFQRQEFRCDLHENLLELHQAELSILVFFSGFTWIILTFLLAEGNMVDDIHERLGIIALLVAFTFLSQAIPIYHNAMFINLRKVLPEMEPYIDTRIRRFGLWFATIGIGFVIISVGFLLWFNGFYIETIIWVPANMIMGMYLMGMMFNGKWFC